MGGSFPLTFAILIQLQLRNAPHSTDFRAIITVAALFAFHPEIFSFGLFGHNRTFNGDSTGKMADNRGDRKIPLSTAESGVPVINRFFRASGLDPIVICIKWCSVQPTHLGYSIILDTTPAPTVRPPSRTAKRNSFSIAIG